MSILDRLLTDGRNFPKQGLLVWIKRPNSDNYLDDEGTPTDESLLDAGYALPVSCFAAVGVGPWFSGATTPITRLMTDIIADPATNQYHILASATKGVAVYDPYTTPDTILAKAQRVMKQTLDIRPTIHYNGAMSKEEIVAAGGTYTGGPTYVADNLGVLRTPGADRPAVQGFRLDGTTYLDTTSTGTPIIPYTSVQTRTGNADFSAFADGTTVKDYTPADPLAAPLWLCEPARTNYALQSATPATHTTGSVPAGTYCLWCEGGTSVTATAGTAIGTFGAATPGTPKTITITTAGTVVLTVAGVVTWVQLESGAFPTSRIYTTTGSFSRAGTVQSFPTAGKIRSNNMAFMLTCVPKASIQQNAVLFSSYIDGSSYTRLHIYDNQLFFRKNNAGTITDCVGNFTTGRPLCIIFIQHPSLGMILTSKNFNESWSSFSVEATNVTSNGKSNLVVGSTCQIGAYNSSSQFTGNISELKTLLIPEGITDPLAWAKKEWGV